MRDQKHERVRQKLYVYHEVLFQRRQRESEADTKQTEKTKKIDDEEDSTDSSICSLSSFQFPRLLKTNRIKRRTEARDSPLLEHSLENGVKNEDQFFTIL